MQIAPRINGSAAHLGNTTQSDLGSRNSAGVVEQTDPLVLRYNVGTTEREKKRRTAP